MSREFASEKTNQESSVIAGRNAVTEALKKGRPIDCIYILKGIERGSMGKIMLWQKSAAFRLRTLPSRNWISFVKGLFIRVLLQWLPAMTFPRWKIFLQKPAISRHLSLSATTLRTHTIWVPSSVPQKLQVRMALSSKTPRRRTDRYRSENLCRCSGIYAGCPRSKYRLHH